MNQLKTTVLPIAMGMVVMSINQTGLQFNAPLITGNGMFKKKILLGTGGISC